MYTLRHSQRIYNTNRKWCSVYNISTGTEWRDIDIEDERLQEPSLLAGGT